ncbi:MAG: hypothetical protein ACXWRE_04820 [Pseudobdellovibrionaceae bacterium]
MKNPFISFIAVMMLVLFNIPNAKAEQTYTTLRGFIFTQVTDERFGTAWQAPDGTVWSLFQGEFSNSGKTLGETVMDSPAVQACLKIKGALPSLMQIKSLLEYFETSADFRSIFPSQSNLYWTSTTLNDGSGVFIRFAKIAPFLDPYGDVTQSTRLLGVQCLHN